MIFGAGWMKSTERKGFKRGSARARTSINAHCPTAKIHFQLKSEREVNQPFVLEDIYLICGFT